jgi:hypothetical protein
MEILFSVMGNVSADKMPYKLKSSHRIYAVSQRGRSGVGYWLGKLSVLYRPKGNIRLRLHGDDLGDNVKK